MLYGPGVRDGVWMDDDSLSREDIQRMVSSEVHRVLSDRLEGDRIKNLFGDIGTLENLWSTDEDWED